MIPWYTGIPSSYKHQKTAAWRVCHVKSGCKVHGFNIERQNVFLCRKRLRCEWMNLTGDLSWSDSLQTAEIVEPLRALKQQQSGLLLHRHLNIIHTIRHQSILTCRQITDCTSYTSPIIHNNIPVKLLIKHFTCVWRESRDTTCMQIHRGKMQMHDMFY